ncbi:hydroxyacid dehydrogenase [Streptomyces sp. NPDC005426]|uniref:hydroxyacid dehydrogenase n=1 Tax=Streptomyces sp. NPDC005426 TaxID=3155344 RepID=UPI0033A53030
MNHRPHALLAMRPGLEMKLFTPTALNRLGTLAAVDAALVIDNFTTGPAREALARTEVLISGWDCPPLDAEVLEAAPRLRAVIHAAGSVKHHITEACWERGIEVTSAAGANAIPVAEYTLAAIILANKRVLPIQDHYRSTRRPHDWMDWSTLHPEMGNYRKTIGIIGYSQVGRRVARMLDSLDVEVLVHDPYVGLAEARQAGITLTGLDELVAASDVISLHAPSTQETRGMMSRRRLALMKEGATLINTSRGALVDQDALVAEIRSGRIWAVVDVTEPETPPADSELYELPNLLLTPHIAGSLGGELRRLGDYALDELANYVSGRPFANPVLARELARIA